MNHKTELDHLTITLKDGRKIGYTEFGVPHGHPIFYFHGLPGSRLDAKSLQDIAVLNQYRLIGIDRPGMGLSTFLPNRTILSWPEDIAEFANSVHISNFSIIGHSGGAPYVAACAYKIPHRLQGAAIVSGMAPFEYKEATTSLPNGRRVINRAIKSVPFVATGLMRLTLMMVSKPSMLKNMLKQLPEVDRCVMKNTNGHNIFIDSVKEGFRQGIYGASHDMQLSVKPWGFKLEDIEFPITIWHGGLDVQAPRAHANLYATLIPGAKLTFFEKEGHLSLLKNHGEEILRSICRDSSGMKS
ncbi:MAG: alpha/beta hydrolase [Tatlockia sp.]|nr:alpha/beta hydrolase [Tatlockia sp.]